MSDLQLYLLLAPIGLVGIGLILYWLAARESH